MAEKEEFPVNIYSVFSSITPHDFSLVYQPYQFIAKKCLRSHSTVTVMCLMSIVGKSSWSFSTLMLEGGTSLDCQTLMLWCIDTDFKSTFVSQLLNDMRPVSDNTLKKISESRFDSDGLFTK